MFAKIVINSKASELNSTFDYRIPKELEEKIHLGTRVIVPFGLGKNTRDGYVIAIMKESEFEKDGKKKCKEISEVVDSYDILTKEKTRLAKWMSLRYFSNISECIKLMVNPETTNKNIENIIKEKKQKIVSIDKKILEEEIMQKYIYELLETLEKDKKSIVVDTYNFKTSEDESIITKYNLTDKRKIALDMLILNGKILEEKQENQKERKTGNKNKNKIIEVSMPLKEYRNLKLVSDGLIKGLEEKGILIKKDEQVTYNEFVYNDYKTDKKEKDLILNNEQQKVYDNIVDYVEMNMYSKHLIFGVTGSGKTEIYIQLIRKAIENEKTAIVLVPEIALTPQIIERFTKRFGSNVGVLHSRLSNRKRYEEWNRILRGEATIVIGTRSAIFAPLKNVGIIIIDEEQDQSYISDMQPKYNAKEVADEIAKIYKCPLVLGSATPLVETYYNAEKKDIILHKLTKRIGKNVLPKVEIVDMKREKGILSERVKEELLENHKKGNQSILFLNRRGYSSLVMCTNCGYTFKCNRCDVSLTYHKKDNSLKCHYCGYTRKYPDKCPECGKKLKNAGIGTEQLEKIVNKELPELSTIRMDLDTISGKVTHEDVINEFKKNNIDILIGTQMVTKGHHFPKVTLSCVVLADSMLNFEGYMATENAFQNIVQVIGRSGREKDGLAIIQTYNPQDVIINIAKESEYEKYYNYEIAARETLNYPPFKDIISVSVLSYKEDKAIFFAKVVRENLQKMQLKFKEKEERKLLKLEEMPKDENIKKEIEKTKQNIYVLQNMIIMQETPYYISKIKNQYRWKVIIKCNYNSYIAKMLNFIKKELTNQKDPMISVELNPNTI